MTKPRALCTGMSLAVTWMSGNGWIRQDSDVERLYDVNYYVELAKQAECAKFDFVFRPDSLFIEPLSLSHSVGFSGLDPTLLLTAVAMQTSHIGLLTTASTTFYSPYILARQLQSLHHISSGRAGWNVVTALDGYENFGLTEMPSTASRYARAQEFTDVVRKLWRSFPKHALTISRKTQKYANPEHIEPIDYNGEHIACKGPLSLVAHASGELPLFQAGASDIGKQFAASIAQGVFAATPNMAIARALREELRDEAAQCGRVKEEIRLIPGLSLYLAESREAARQLFNETRSEHMKLRHLKLAADALGITVQSLQSKSIISASDLKPMGQVRSKTHCELIRALVLQQTLTLDELLQSPEVAGSGHWLIVGTVEDAVSEIKAWREAGAIDGFIALPGGSRTCFDLVCNALMPALMREGLVQKAYSGSTFLANINKEFK